MRTCPTQFVLFAQITYKFFRKSWQIRKDVTFFQNTIRIMSPRLCALHQYDQYAIILL